MKKLTNYIFAALLLLMTAGLQAQVVEVCAGDGTDSVTLSLAQYQYGNIQWQYSEDTLTWTDILGAHDTVFRCLPEQECYYRARIEYPNCPLDTTQVTHILFTPTANAGPDRILNEGYVTTLFGNKVEDENTRCMWQVIEGDSPDLEDPTYRNSRFTGPDTLYKLTWTVANACGVSTDTVEIRYVHTVMYDAIAIVDTTDIILSDSAERASGIYRIVFSNPAPNITDSTILMGMDGDDFLRRVIDFEWFGDTCEIYASPADFLDILVEGAINFDIPLNFNDTNQRRGQRHIYTRAELMNDPRFVSGQWNNLIQEVVSDSYIAGMRSDRSVILPGDVVELSSNFQIRDFNPYFSEDFRYDVDMYRDPTDHTIRSFAYWIGEFHTDFTLRLMEGSATVTIDIPTPVSKEIPNPFRSGKTIGKLGLYIPIVFSGTVESQNPVDIPIKVTTPIRVMGTYHGNPLKYWRIFYDMDLKNYSEWPTIEKTEPDLNGNSLNYTLAFSVGGKFGFSLFEDKNDNHDDDVFEANVGLWFSVLPTLSYSICIGSNGFKSQTVSSYVEASLSGALQLGFGLGGDIWHDIWGYSSWHSPDRISANTNRNLVQPSANSYIQDPIYVHVYNQDNRRVKSGRKVLFEATGGVVSATPSGNGSASAFATTNASGVAQIYWKPLSSNASLKASVLDCQGNHIKGSPLYFYSNGVGDLCLNSNLSLAIGNNGRFITFGGSSPFLYSSDGVTWLPEFNMSYPLAAGTYFVKDVNGCIASTTYTVQEATPPCNLTTSTYQDGLQVRFVANNGTAPYHFYVDGLDYTTSGTTQRVFQHTFAQDGEYTLTVTDANGCTQSTVVRLLEGITPPTVVTVELYNTANQVYDAVMGAVTDNGGAEITERGIQWSLSSDMSNATMVASNSTAARYVCQITGVTPGTTYYARAYATNARGYTGYGSRIITLTVPGTTPGPGSTTSCGVSSVRANETGSNGTITAVRDHQNNSYAVVQIGNQCWLKENMRCTTSPSTGANMVENPAVETNMSSTERRAYYYDNNPANAANGYGLLYNWPAAMDGSTTAGARGICPEGWHLPTDAEWTAMMNTAVSIYQPGVTPTSQSSGTNVWLDGGNTSISSMLSGGADWQSDNSGEATPGNYNHSLRNVTGFIAVPAGFYAGGFGVRGQYVYCWSSSPYDSGVAWGRGWYYNSAGVVRGYVNKEYAIAVRCVRNDGGGDTPTPPSPSSTTSCGVSSVRANETGSNGTITAVRDHQNNSYAVVQIGSQCWLKENMRCTTSPSTGANMVENPAVQANMSATVRRAYYYDNNPANAANGYGLLYNWPAAMDGSTTAGARGICPEGWHLPTDAEWTTLMNTAVSIYQPGVTPTSQNMATNAWLDGGNTAVSSMLSGGTDWQTDDSGEATPGNYSHALRNVTGFIAVPAGYYDGGFSHRGQIVPYWSSSPYGSGDAWDRGWNYGDAGVYREYDIKEFAIAVRCLRNDGGTSAAVLPTVSTSAVENVTATTATCGGNVTSDGGANVTERGVCWSTNQNPTISDNHTTDGSGVGSFTSNISGLTAGNTYYVRAYATNSVGTAYGNEVSVTVPGSTPAPGSTTSCGVSSIHSNETGSNGTITAVRDHQNNSYAVVQIGNQCWLKENMRCTTSPSTGTYLIPTAGTFYTNSGKQARWYNNDSTTYAPMNYGLLYNWNAAADTFNTAYGETSVWPDYNNAVSVTFTGHRRGICPEGWHLPSNAEWTQLIDYVSSQSGYLCYPNTNYIYIAKSLADSVGWNSALGFCSIGNNQSTNNATGFSAVPAGSCLSLSFEYAGEGAVFWSSAQHYPNSAAFFCSLYFADGEVSIGYNALDNGYSVRCLRD